MALENKLGLTNSAELARQEELLSKQAAKQLFDSGLLFEIEVGTFAGLSAIHKALFSDIYDFAGKIRDVNIAKDNFQFAPRIFLEQSLTYIDKLPHQTFDEIVDWNTIDKDEYFNAMVRSHVSTGELKYLLLKALTDDLSQQTFFKGLDTSYYYEGYTFYKTEDL